MPELNYNELSETTAMHELTARPLPFGDPAQIRAHRFLARLEDAFDAYMACRHEHTMFPRPDDFCVCECIAGFNDDVLAALENRLRTRRFFAPR